MRFYTKILVTFLLSLINNFSSGVVIILVMMYGFSVRSEENSEKTVQDTSISQISNSSIQKDSEEIVLDVIEIKGKVEKPGLIIMPKRVEPEMGEVELERNFQREVREGIGELPKPEDELRKVERIKSIKKTVEKERK